MGEYQLLEELAHQNNERISERMVHAKNIGAHKVLKIASDISRFTKAAIFKLKTETPITGCCQAHIIRSKLPPYLSLSLVAEFSLVSDHSKRQSLTIIILSLLTGWRSVIEFQPLSRNMF